MNVIYVVGNRNEAFIDCGAKAWLSITNELFESCAFQNQKPLQFATMVVGLNQNCFHILAIS